MQDFTFYYFLYLKRTMNRNSPNEHDLSPFREYWNGIHSLHNINICIFLENARLSAMFNLHQKPKWRLDMVK